MSNEKVLKYQAKKYRSDLKDGKFVQSGRLTYLCMSPIQDTLQQAGRKETRTGG